MRTPGLRIYGRRDNRLGALIQRRAAQCWTEGDPYGYNMINRGKPVLSRVVAIHGDFTTHEDKRR